jgi:histidyl-tRNA synthetase
MNDILPDETPHWRLLEQTVSRLLASYGYGEIRLPLVEKTELFSRSIGEVTDIVEREMYSFDDRNGDSLTLRPEGTAGCVRAVIQQGLLAVPQRLWYAGPMFRYERPQKGRQRQFQQIGVESFGIASPDMDAEHILVCARLWQELGLADCIQLQINSIGSNTARKAYRESLVGYLEAHKEALDEDSQRRLQSNPLRILDSKNPQTQALLDGAPALADYLDEESRDDCAKLQELLTAGGAEYVVKVEQLGGKATPAIGFAMGMERLVLLMLETAAIDAVPMAQADIYAVAVGDAAHKLALATVESLRTQLGATLSIVQHAGGGSFKSQFKRADKSGARVALIWGEDEAQAQSVTIKQLRDGAGQAQKTGQQTVPIEQLEATLRTVFAD